MTRCAPGLRGPAAGAHHRRAAAASGAIPRRREPAVGGGGGGAGGGGERLLRPRPGHIGKPHTPRRDHGGCDLYRGGSRPGRDGCAGRAARRPASKRPFQPDRGGLDSPIARHWNCTDFVCTGPRPTTIRDAGTYHVTCQYRISHVPPYSRGTGWWRWLRARGVLFDLGWTRASAPVIWFSPGFPSALFAFIRMRRGPCSPPSGAMIFLQAQAICPLVAERSSRSGSGRNGRRLFPIGAQSGQR